MTKTAADAAERARAEEAAEGDRTRPRRHPARAKKAPKPRDAESATPGRAILLRYHEVALKGGNRSWFEDRLVINAKRLIQRSRGIGGKQPTAVREFSRIVVHAELDRATREALGRLFGISSFSPMRAVVTDLAKLKKAALEEFEIWVTQHGMPRTYRVKSRRSDKVIELSSPDIDREIGSFIMEAHPDLIVSLKEPDVTVGVEVRSRKSFIWTEQVPGLGGLPVGTNGRVLALLSGGLDSPVAAIQAMKRGSPVTFLHFYGVPFVGEEVLQKVEDLARIVYRYQPEPDALLIVPFGKIQEKVALLTNPKLRTVLYRRLMVRIACEVAKRQGIQALVTGEAIGQVASQTIENLATIDAVATIPILRPLITRDKDEIVREAKHWGTHDTSILPGVDCCTLFADRHPSIHASIPLIEEQEARLDMPALVAEAIAGIEIRRIR